MTDEPLIHIEPWDSAKRTRRIDQDDQPITAEDFARYEWVDITSSADPDDVHRYVRLRGDRG